MYDYTKEQLCIIWLDSFLGLEYKHKAQILEGVNNTSSITAFLEQSKDYLINALGENVYSTLKSSANREYLEFILNIYKKKGITAITFRNENYPKTFKNINCPPIVIYCKGDTSLLNAKNLFGVVGSRKSLNSSLALTERYVKELIKADFIPVTGIAEGVDAKVLTTAIEEKSKAISVIAGGLDNLYPKQHFDLVEKVSEKGLVVSEYPPQVEPRPFMFPVRNRLISALSIGVLIVSGGMKSGTLYTAEYAEEYGKDLFVVPYSAGVISGAGCNDLIKRGAMLTDTPEDILSFYGVESSSEELNLSVEEKEIVNVLFSGEKHIEKISSALNKRVFEIMPTLSVLEIKKVVVKNGNTYGLTRNDLED
ncbi:MAG: DNA-processing protein DprA [Clostridia bacterium]|nr:DNA-processing protein DprA [Clostridia bacterium]